MDFRKALVVKPGSKANLSKRDTDARGVADKQQAKAALKKSIARLDDLQYVLYAENKRSVLVVLQAMDAAGKDGTIRHVMTGLNPQGCKVISFKEPSREELSHDFLWRIHKAVPPAGEVGIFNRSHYEDVLIVRVRKLVPKSVWSQRYEQINAFEKLLSENGVTILKFFLHISKDEQKERLTRRLKDPKRMWKAAASDWEERKRWDDYAEAYEDALERCSTKWAPWYVIPADRKWFRDLAVARIIVDTLEEMNLELPPPPEGLSRIVPE